MTTVEKLAKEHDWNLPTKCYLCGSKLAINDTWSRIYCPNNSCPSYAYTRICRYLSRMGVMEIAGATVQTLIDEGFIKDIPDLYKIDWDEVAELDGFGVRSTSKMKKEIDNHRDCTLPQFLSGFNIAGMGETQIEKMVKDMTLDEVLHAKPNDFLTRGISTITATKFYNGLQSLIVIILKTSKFVNIDYDYEEDEPELVSNKLEGMSFCFTGKIEGYTRQELEQMVIENGGTISSVKKGLTALVTDDSESGSSKNQKAKQLGIRVISSKEFLKLLK